MKNNKKLHILVAYFLIYVVWGSTYYFIGVALNDFPPFLLGAIRFSVAGLLLLGWCLFQGEAVFKKSLIRKSAVSGLVLLFIDMDEMMDKDFRRGLELLKDISEKEAMATAESDSLKSELN